jgi:hypothetical protein
MWPRRKNRRARVETRWPEYTPDGHFTENGVPAAIQEEAYVWSVQDSANAALEVRNIAKAKNFLMHSSHLRFASPETDPLPCGHSQGLII